MHISTHFSENNIEGRAIYHIARIFWAGGHYNQIQFSSILLKRFSQTGRKLTTWNQGSCLDCSICVCFYGLQSLFIAYMKTVLEVSSSKAKSGYSQEGIYYSA